MTRVRAALADYLRIRRRLGFEMPQDGRLLEGFVEFLEQAGAERITTELALGWARKPADAHPYYWRQRLTVARGFARHLATIDPASEVPSTDLLPGHRPQIAPYIYGVQQQSPAEWAAAMLGSQEPQRGGAQRGWLAATPPVPVVDQRRVVRGRRRGHHPVPDDRGPGELAQVEAAGAASEHPLVPPGGVERVEVPGRDPARRLVRVREAGPLVDQPPHMRVQCCERAFGHPDPVVRSPPGDDRVELGDQRVGVGPTQGPHLGGQSPADPPQRIVTRLGQQLAVRKSANGEAQKVHTLREVRDPGLVLVEDQTPGSQPVGKPGLNPNLRRCLGAVGVLTCWFARNTRRNVVTNLLDFGVIWR